MPSSTLSTTHTIADLDCPAVSVFADSSTREGVSAAAYFRHPGDYGVDLLVNDDSDAFTGEAAALTRAAWECDPEVPTMLYTDCRGLVELVHQHQERTQASPRKAPATRHPVLAPLLARIDTGNLRVEHCYGHGRGIPPAMYFVDVLSRYLARHYTELGLRPGAVLRAGEFFPTFANSVRPDNAIKGSILRQLNRQRRELALAS